MHNLDDFVGLYRIDLKASTWLIAEQFERETSGAARVDRELLEKELRATPLCEQEVYLEITPRSLVLTGDGDRGFLEIDAYRRTPDGATLRVLDEDGQARDFRISWIDQNTVHLESDSDSIGRYAWAKFDGVNTRKFTS